MGAPWIGNGLEGEVNIQMRRKGRDIPKVSETDLLNEFMEDIAPREPRIRIYRVNSETKKHTFLGTAAVEGFSLNDLREWYGSGAFLLRTVRSNGKYGPSRVVRIGSLSLKRN